MSQLWMENGGVEAGMGSLPWAFYPSPSTTYTYIFFFSFGICVCSFHLLFLDLVSSLYLLLAYSLLLHSSVVVNASVY